IAVLVKLTRVAMLVPVAILIGVWFGNSEGRKEKKSWRDLPIPWFIFGFLAMSAVYSLGIIPEWLNGYIVV
ncbi:putative sulfate exporter family transporter, partial [Lysinibacillus sp. D4A1_S13]|uniref:putative sulfate exporter family transporter n=1 Tax=Lysinibacillus sp. D4A1_S13 TaxID=2941228 RepID=UPI0020C15F72